MINYNYYCKEFALCDMLSSFSYLLQATCFT